MKHSSPAFLAALSLAAVTGLASTASAQDPRAQAQLNQQHHMGARNYAHSPHYVSPRLGVPSKAPRPIKSLIPSGGPPLERKGTLLPPPQPRRDLTPGRGGAGRPHPAPRAIGGNGDGAGVPRRGLTPLDRGGIDERGPAGGSGRDGMRRGRGEGRGEFRGHDGRHDGRHDGHGGGIHGSYKGDHWRFKFHLGHDHHLHHDHHHDLFWWRYPFYAYTLGAYWYDDYRYPLSPYWDYNDDFISGWAVQDYQQAQAEAEYRREQFEAMTPVEKGDVKLSEGDAQAAIGYYVQHLDVEKDDALAARSLALALIDAGRIDQGAATMLLAYEKNPSVLANQPIRPSQVAGGVREFRKLMTDAVQYANRTKLASAWLSAAVLAQAEGRKDVAANLVAKAKQAGLSGETLRQMELATGSGS